MPKKMFEFDPDYVVFPGETLLEVLETIGMSQKELAERTKRPLKTINEIMKGKSAITPDTAIQLERVLGVPASFWNSYERNYREKVAQLEERKRLAEEVEWLKEIPLASLIKRGFVSKSKDKIEQVKEALTFFGCASVEAWRGVWQQILSSYQVVYRRATTFESEVGAVATWLRQGEIESQKIPCGSYNATAFREALKEIRLLTRQDPEEFVPKLRELCSKVGVAVVFVPEMPKCRVNGATRWLRADKALLQLSLRYKTDDHLWFTFFHEAGHILLHKKKVAYLEFQDNGDQIEHEANQFAADLLLPPADYEQFVKASVFTKSSVIAFAEKVGIAPGIVVGRLQHDSIIPFRNLNDLKRRFEWATTR